MIELDVDCGLLGCGAKAGEPCVNSVNGSPRSEPHSNRVARVGAVPGVELSTSARLAQTLRELAEVRAAAERNVERLTHVRGELGKAQRALAASQADLTAAEEQIKTLTEERDWERQVVGMLRKNEEIRARVIRERNAERAELRKELEQLRAQVLSTRPPQECRCAPQIPPSTAPLPEETP